MIFSKLINIYHNWKKLDPKHYNRLLEFLEKSGYSFVLPSNFKEEYSSESVNKLCLIVHDVDVRVNGCKVFVKLEEKHGIRSTFFLRLAEYFSHSIKYFKDLENQGWEIGFHYDALSRSDGNLDLAWQLFNVQLKYTRSFFNIKSTRSHGDPYNSSIDNKRLYLHHLKDWIDLGLSDFTILPSPYSYIRDTHGKLVIPKKLEKIVLLNFHSDWW